MLKQRKPTLFFPILMAVLVVVLAVWLFYTFSTGNLLWFQSPERSYEPGRIVIHYYGTTVELEPGTEAFRAVERALNDSLASFRGRIPIGLSEDTLSDYRQEEYVLEVFFAYDIGPVIGLGVPVNHILIPIDGRHSGNGYVFVGNDGEWLASALIMEDPQLVVTALTNLGYTQR